MACGTSVMGMCLKTLCETATAAANQTELMKSYVQSLALASHSGSQSPDCRILLFDSADKMAQAAILQLESCRQALACARATMNSDGHDGGRGGVCLGGRWGGMKSSPPLDRGERDGQPLQRSGAAVLSEADVGNDPKGGGVLARACSQAQGQPATDKEVQSDRNGLAKRKRSDQANGRFPLQQQKGAFVQGSSQQYVGGKKWNTWEEGGWRKYGRKVGRGKIQVRDYYRCSMRERTGCSARKQVDYQKEGGILVRILQLHTCHSGSTMNVACPEVEETATAAATAVIGTPTIAGQNSSPSCADASGPGESESDAVCSVGEVEGREGASDGGRRGSNRDREGSPGQREKEWMQDHDELGAECSGGNDGPRGKWSAEYESCCDIWGAVSDYPITADATASAATNCDWAAELCSGGGDEEGWGLDYSSVWDEEMVNFMDMSEWR